MPRLHLGVIDVPYVNAPSPRQRKVRASTVTTGDVAGWLEDEYHIMEVFFNEKQAKIAADLEKGMQSSLEALLMGAPSTLDPFGSATSKIEDTFKTFLSMKEMEKLGIPGVPTVAALTGKSARHKRRRGKRRPSFIDTGLYQASFKAWVT